MMNDRFSAQLRQHLLTTADERPADGRLEAIDATVAVTTQRHPIVARLRWSPTRIDPFPSVAMRYALVVVALIIAIVAALAVGFGQSRRTVLEGAYTSTIHGFSMGVPPGWETRPATEPWGGEPLDFDSTAADVIFDPALGDGLYLVVASQTFSGMSEDGWKASVLEWTCPGYSGGEMWSWRVDGASAYQQGPCNSGSIIGTDTRGYLIRLVASSNEPRLAETYDWDWLMPVLETVDLRPEDAIDPSGTGTPVPRCADIAAGATYLNRFGTPKLSATVPVGAEGSWHGYRDEFIVSSYRDDFIAGDCRFGEPIRIDASRVDAVINDACDPWTRSPVEFGTLAEAAEAIVAQPGHRTSEPTEVTIAGHAALRLEISVEGSTCIDGIGLWYGNEFGLDRDAIVYLVEMDGDTLGFAVWYLRSQTTPAQLAEAEAIVASIQIGP